MLQFDEYKVKLNNLTPALQELAQALDLEGAERELDMLQAESAADGFWDNLAKAQKVQQRIKNLQDKVDSQNRRQGQWQDLMALCEMGNEFEDESLIPELEEGFAALEANMESARLETLLTGEYDRSNVILTIHPGAGGHRGPGLGPDALSDVHPLDRAPRLFLPDYGLPGGGRGGHQVGYHYG